MFFMKFPKKNFFFLFGSTRRHRSPHAPPSVTPRAALLGSCLAPSRHCLLSSAPRTQPTQPLHGHSCPCPATARPPVAPAYNTASAPAHAARSPRAAPGHLVRSSWPQPASPARIRTSFRAHPDSSRAHPATPARTTRPVRGLCRPPVRTRGPFRMPLPHQPERTRGHCPAIPWP